MKLSVTFFFVLPGLAAAGTVQLTGTYAENTKRSPDAQVCRGVRALAAEQGTFTGQSGRVVQGTWEWARGAGVAAENAAGIVAVALARSVDSARACGAEAAVARFAEDRAVAHAGGEFLFDPDIEALALASKLTGTPKYHTLAREAFVARYGGASGREIVERWFMLRPASLVGFDAAMAIRAAIAVGAREAAIEIADATLATLPRWGERTGDPAQLATSRGALLEALLSIDANRYHAGAEDLVHHLLLTQGTDGTWAWRNTQATAYAVLGLRAAGDEFAVAAAERGRRWLHASQLENGSWATFNDFAPEPFVGEVIHEVSAEAIRAVARR